MGKAIMFFGFVWLLTCIAGGIMTGQTVGASTRLTAAVSSGATTIPVASTNGFPVPGTLIIEGERVRYSVKAATSFSGTTWSPLLRGAGGTAAVAHSLGEAVRTLGSAMVNNALDYNLAVIADSTGWMAFIQLPLAVFRLLKTFIATPFGFLGTDLALITAVWGVAMLGLVVSIAMAVIGGRRV